MDKAKEFLKVFRRAEKKYGKSDKRLVGDCDVWKDPWKVLVATILSAQSRDETTIPIAEKLFKKFDSVEKLGKAKYSDVFKILKSMNYNKTKTKNVIGCCKMIVSDFRGVVPEDIDDLVKLPGVGRKTANLVIGECFGKDAICVDTHVHRISNVLGFVNTKDPEKTEKALMDVVPKRYWSRVNRIFVLWGKDVPGRDRDRLLGELDS